MAEAGPYIEKLADQWKVIHDLKPTALRVTTSTSLLNKDVSVCIANFFWESIQLLERGKWTKFELSREFDEYILSLAIGGVEVVNAEDEFK